MTSSPSEAGLTKAKLRIMEPPSSVGAGPGGELGLVEFQFNPSKLSLRKTIGWQRSPARAANESALPEFVGSGPRELSVDVFLDATATRDNSVEQRVQQLMVACVPTKKSLAAHHPASPWVKFEWGSATVSATSFDAVLTNFSVEYSLFDVDGKALRATCSLSLEEAATGPGSQNPTSGAREARRMHRLVAGDSLPQLAWQEYGDSTVWRVIAEANEIDDPMELILGNELLVPATTSAGSDGVR